MLVTQEYVGVRRQKNLGLKRNILNKKFQILISFLKMNFDSPIMYWQNVKVLVKSKNVMFMSRQSFEKNYNKLIVKRRISGLSCLFCAVARNKRKVRF